MRRIALFGDSVFAGYGLKPPQGIAALLTGRLPHDQIIAAGIPDQTAADGLARIDTVTGDIVLVQFGLNDAIQGVPPADTIEALTAIVDRKRAEGSVVLLVEALVPESSTWPKLVDHDGLIQRVAQSARVGWVPDIMTASEGHRQQDGLHPDPIGAAKIAKALMPYLT